ncbi:MAG: gamma-glutamyltransferase family protein [Gammaproteobacteria bacterium]
MHPFDESSESSDEQELRDPGVIYPQRITHSKSGVVVTAQYRASQAGAEVLANGGNAFDAAAAAAFALGVCEPAASGLGGQTMAVIYHSESRKKIALDGSSRAPNRVEPGELPKSMQLRGYRATTVPSTPAVLGYLVERYGALPLSEVLKPAIQIAEEGYRITQLQNSLTRRELRHLRAGTAAQFFLRKGMHAYRVGALLKQNVLAGTLRRLAEAGIEDFYQGDIARTIHDDMVRHDGYLREDDLAQIPWPVERRPVTTKFGNLRVLTMPPPGAGLALVEILNVLDQLPERYLDIDSPQGAVTLAKVIQQANIDRIDQPRDPNLHLQHIDEEDMVDPNYAAKIARKIRRRPKTIHSSGETTHLSVMDGEGNVVALTQSIERVYGSYSATAELGFLYNNYMSAFEYEDITHPFYLRPNGVPWASVAPTIVFRGRTPWLAIGSPGSERIASAVAQILLRLRRGEGLFDAVDAPRLHCSVKGKVSFEASRMDDRIADEILAHGLEPDPRDPYSFYLGCIALVMRGRRGEISGVADPRRDGSAAGPKKL